MTSQNESDDRAASPTTEAILRDDLRRAAEEIFLSSTVAGRAVMRVLAIAHIHRLDASRLIDSLASEFSGNPRRQLYQLADAVVDGTPPVEAISRSPQITGSTAAIALCLAQQSGNLPQLYAQFLELADPDDSLNPLHRNPASELIRLVIWFFLALLMTTFLSLFVVPTFEKMFEEFGLTLPAVTQLWVQLMDYLPLLFCLAFMFVVIYLLLQSPRILRSYKLQWNPLNSGRRILTDSAEVRSLVAIVIRTGLDLARGLRTIEAQHPDPRMRQRLAMACRQVDQGSDPWHALSSARLVSKHDAWILTQTATGSMRAWLIERWITAGHETMDRRSQLVLRMLSLFGTVVLGLIVAMTCLAVFLPLCELVIGLS